MLLMFDLAIKTSSTTSTNAPNAKGMLNNAHVYKVHCISLLFCTKKRFLSFT